MDSRDGAGADPGLGASSIGLSTGGSIRRASAGGSSSGPCVTLLAEGFCLRAQSSSHLIAAALVGNRFLKRKSSILLSRLSSTMKLRRVLFIDIYVNIDYIIDTIDIDNVQDADYANPLLRRQSTKAAAAQLRSVLSCAEECLFSDWLASRIQFLWRIRGEDGILP
jgi:hypothetical protein